MVKKKGGKDEFDFDDDFPDIPGDMGDSEFDGLSPRDDRSPVMKVTGGFREGLTEHIKDPKNQVKFLRKVLPDGYKQAIDITDESLSIASELYDHTLKEAKPVVGDIKKLLKLVVPRESAFLPKKWTDAIHEALEPESRAPSQEEIEETAIGSALADVFKVQSDKQDAMYEDQKQRDNLQTAIQLKGNATIVQQLAGIRVASERLVGYQDSVNASFQRKSLELQFRSYFVQRRQLDEFQKYATKAHTQLDSIVKNTGLPDSVKIHNMEMASDMIKRRMFDNITQWTSGIGRRFLQNSKQEISNFFQSIGGSLSMVLFGAETAKEMAQFAPGGAYGMAGKTLGSGFAGWLTDKLAKPISEKLKGNDQVMRGHFFLQNLLGLAPQRLSEWLGDYGKSFLPESMQGGMLSDAEGWIKQLFGQGYKRDTELGKLQGTEELDKASHITNLTRRTIEEVIPGWLSKIHRELAVIRTGNASLGQIEYSFASRKFETVEEKAEAIRKEIYDPDKLKRLDEVTDTIIDMVDTDKELDEATRKIFKDELLKDLRAERVFDPRKYANHPDDELAMFIRSKYKMENVGSDFDQKFKVATDRETQEQIQKVQFATKEARRFMPDIRDLGKRSLAAGDISAWERLGIVQRVGDTYHLDEEAYIKALRDPSSQQAITSDRSQFDAMAPFLSRHMGGLVSGSDAKTRRVSPAVFVGAPRYHVGGVGGLEPGEVPVVIKEGEEVITPEDPRHVANSGDFKEIIEVFKEELFTKMEEYSTKPDIKYTNELIGNLIRTNVQIAYLLEAGVTGGVGGGSGKMHWADRMIHGGLDIGKGIKDYTVSSFKFGNRMMGKFFKGMGKVGGWLKDQGRKMLDYYDATDFRDVYIRGKEKAILLARDIKAGEYIDKTTGKVITSLKDIKGEVVDKTGKIVLTAEEYGKGLFDRNGKPLLAMAGGFVRSAFNAARDLIQGGNRKITAVTTFLSDQLKQAIGFAKAHTDVYVKGETTPRLFARLIRAGSYLMQKTGKPISSVTEITDTITDLQGNVVITAAEIANPGIVDKNGDPIESLGSKVFGMGTKALGFVKDKALEYGKKGIELASKGWNWLKNAGAGVYNKMTGGGSFDFTMLGGSSRPVVASIKALYKMLNRRLPGQQESDGDIDSMFDKFIGQKIFTATSLRDFGGKFKGMGDKLRALGANIKDKLTEWKAKLVGTAIGASPTIIAKYEKLKETLKAKYNLTQERANSLVEELKSKYGDNFREAQSTALGLKSKMMGNIALGLMKLGSFFKPSPGEQPASGTIREGSWEDSARDEAAKVAEERAEEAVEQRRESIGIMRKIRDLFVKNDKREEERDENAVEEEGESLGGKLIGKVLDMFGLGGVGKAMSGIWDKLSSAAEDTAIGTIIGTVTGKLAEGVTKLGGAVTNSILGKTLGGAARGLGRGALAAGRGAMALGGLGLGAAGTAIGAVGGAALTGLGALATVLFSPIALTAAAIGGTIYGGYKLFKSFGKRDQYLSKFRYAQYGFDPGSSWRDGDDSEIETITKLEEKLIPHVISAKGQASRINPNAITVEELVDIFGIDKEDDEEVRNWVYWFSRRFRPVFLSHMTVLFDIGKGRVQLGEIDDRLSTDERMEYLKRVHYPASSEPYNAMMSPFPTSWYEVVDMFTGGDELSIDGDDVQDYFNEYMQSIKDARGRDADKLLARHEGTKEGEAKKKELQEEANKPLYQKAAEGIFKYSGMKYIYDTGKKIGGWLNELIADSKDYGVQASNQFGITSPGGKAFMSIVGLPVTLAKMALAGIGIGADKHKFITDKSNRLNKFRMYQYGYSPNDSYDNVEAILLLEEGLFPYLQYGSTGATLAGNLPVEELFKIFDIEEDDDEDIHKFSEWFHRRFKPIFLSHATVLNSITTGVNMHQADAKLSPQQKLDYLKRVHFQLTDGPYTFKLSPFPTTWLDRLNSLNPFASKDIDIEPSDIDYIFKAIQKEIQATVKSTQAATGKTDEFLGKTPEAKALGKEMEKKKIDDEKAKQEKAKKEAQKKEEAVKRKDKEKSWADILKEKGSDLWDAAKGTGANMLKTAGSAVSSAVNVIGDAARKYASPLAELGSYIGKTAANWKPLKGNAKKNEQIMIDHALAAGITNPKELAMLLGQIHEETGFYAMEENLRYRPQPLIDTFKAVRKRGLAFATELSKLGPETIANFIYADENRDKSRKLGNTQPGDGWKYRGRGFLQITGRGNYEHHGKRLGLDLINNPDLAADPHVAAELAIDFWKSRVGSKLGGSGDVKAVTGVVNGVATMRLQERIDGYNMYMDKIAKGELKASGDAVQKLAGKGTGSAEDAKTTPDQAPAPATPKKDDTKPAVAAAAATPAPAAKTTAANAAIAAATPAAVTTAAPKVTPAPTSSTPGVVPVSTGAALNVAASKRASEVSSSQAQTQRAAEMAASASSMDGVANILTQQLNVQLSMDVSLKTVVELLKNGVGNIPNAAGAKGGERIADAARRTNPAPSSNKQAPMNMGRS